MTDTAVVDYVDFGDVSRSRLRKQTQYGVRYVNGDVDYPQHGNGLRFLGLDSPNYHDVKIHRDDVEIFVQRFFLHQARSNANG